MKLDKITIDVFFALIRAGLWEKEVKLLPFGEIDWRCVYRIAAEQSVSGLILAGLDHSDVKPPKHVLLQWIGEVQALEQRNIAMNYFIGVIAKKTQAAGIFTVLVKGQGVAQCYERPLWRSSGDVDFFFEKSSYRKAIDFFIPLSSSNKTEGVYSQHLGMTIDQWYVEVHGSLRTGLTAKIDKAVDAVQDATFDKGGTRVWFNGATDVFLPNPDNDVFLVFTHFIKHLYKGGVRLRQVCDWCRLLWSYRDGIDIELLKRRLEYCGLMLEWRSFAAIAAEYLGMDALTIPLYSEDVIWQKRARLLVDYMLQYDYKEEGSTFAQKVRATQKLTEIFTFRVLRFFPSIFLNVNLMKLKERLFTKGSNATTAK